MENGIFFHSKVSLERIVGGSQCPNIEQKKAGVKKEQVKGCGSVNRPTPGSQRPAEPVATGFLRGVNYLIFRGRFWGLGVKLGVVNARISQCSAILYGVRIGVLAIPAISRASRAPGCPPCTLCGGEPPGPPSFFSAPTQPRPPQKLRC